MRRCRARIAPSASASSGRMTASGCSPSAVTPFTSGASTLG
ncbi:E3 ubiquitin-protein ligase [Musa troglodytarum]|uniref:E3 ubiquitin-protein ligase n=1 Tax=Musa troglodytarum TaxID=320322 RepID=A0A9E7EQA3_9LILI|nr:E3 ubiquitin-protein ligase [Musa troglodytarum]